MAQNDLNEQIQDLFQQNDDDQSAIIKQLDKIVKKFGIEAIQEWRNTKNKSKNTLIHELVEKDYPDVIRHIVCEHSVAVRVHREMDGKTALELAQENQNQDISDLLKELEVNQAEKDSSERENDETMDDQDDDEEDSGLKKKTNIIWIDLEMTSIEDPKVMECAVIITDKHLKELDRDQWVVHYDEEELKQLGDWHQKQFANVDKGGNGLFKACLKSKLTEKEVEQKLLKIIKRYCPEKECPIAGSSIQVDKDVLRQRMPEVNNYLHYRIIDVSSFRAMLKRWAPNTDNMFINQLSKDQEGTVNHRAMDDIEWSIKMMEKFRPLLTGSERRYGRPKRSSVGGEKHHGPGGSAASKFPHSSMDSHQDSKKELYADEKALEARIKLDQRTDVRALQLNKTDQNIYNRNPHLREIFIDQKQIENFRNNFQKRDRILKPSSTVSMSSIRPTANITTEHWGQRKLILGEIEFLSNYAPKGKFTVIYMGAAPGVHINYLSDLFPTVNFVLVDSKTIDAKKTDKVVLRSEKNMEDWIKDYCNRNNILFICNKYTYNISEDIEDCIERDNKYQINWFKKLKPAASLLKLRLSRSKKQIKFLDGDIILEPWSSRHTNDCRVHVLGNAKSKEYDMPLIVAAFSNFQNKNRVMYYQYPLDDFSSEELDHCYDCCAEIFILHQYLTTVQGLREKSMINDAVSDMSKGISKNIYDKNRPQFGKGMRTLSIIPKIQTSVL